jgi:hypothetical protein
MSGRKKIPEVAVASCKLIGKTRFDFHSFKMCELKASVFSMTVSAQG